MEQIKKTAQILVYEWWAFLISLFYLLSFVFFLPCDSLSRFIIIATAFTMGRWNSRSWRDFCCTLFYSPSCKTKQAQKWYISWSYVLPKGTSVNDVTHNLMPTCHVFNLHKILDSLPFVTSSCEITTFKSHHWNSEHKK